MARIALPGPKFVEGRGIAAKTDVVHVGCSATQLAPPSSAVVGSSVERITTTPYGVPGQSTLVLVEMEIRRWE
jgi:hypothetical protein